ncbi:antibiotic biosynthesis monooxygenase, partial [Agrobacterium radiobacter]
MADLTNVAYFTAKPGRSGDLGDELLQLVAPSRNEEGCLRYEIHQSTDVDLPLNFHPVAIRAPAVLNTPSGAV